MTEQSTADAFWATFLANRPNLAPGTTYYEAFQFGNTPAMADELAALVLAGVKTATSDLLWKYEAASKPLMRAGDLHIVLDGRGTPA